MSTVEEILEWRGCTVVDRDGDKIGTLEEIYLDRETEQPEWALVNTGVFGTKSSFVPLQGAAREDEDVRVAYGKDEVKGAPSIEADRELSEQEERALYGHYGLEYSEAAGTSQGTSSATGGAPDAGDAGAGYGTSARDASTGGDAMTRSEEELRVGTAQRERGRVRLKKHVVTEDVQQTVPVRREEVRLEREPITDANVDDATSGPDITEAEHEVTLHEEQPVVEKRAVPKERVRLGKDVETGEEQVSDTVRKEQVDVEDDR